MVKKSKKKGGGFFNLVGTLIIAALIIVGLICFVSIDANGGVTVAGTTILFNKVTGTGFIFYGLSSVFGGQSDVGMYTIFNSEVGDASKIGQFDLNANIGVIIGLVLVLISGILVLLLRKNKVGMLLTTVLLLTGSILLLCGGQLFSLANQDTIGGLKLEEFATISYLDIGSLTAGVFGIIGSLIALIQTVVLAIKK